MPLVRKPTKLTKASTSAAPEAQDAAAVLRALRSGNSEERWAAARAAATLAGESAALSAALRAETEPHVREALFSSLARIGTPESIGELLGLLRSDHANLRAGALDALRTLGEGLRELLPQLLRDADPDIRILTCELARALPSQEASAALCALLAQEPDLNVCAAAVDVLAEVGTPAACSVLTRCAARFAPNPFLGFAVQIAIDRINAASDRARD